MHGIRLSLTALVVTAAAAAAAPPILQSNFADGLGGWQAMGASGSLRVSREITDLRDGKPSLAFDYEIGPKKFGVAVLPCEARSLAALTQIRFWVKTGYPTSLAVVLSEKGGGNYTALIWSPGGTWQEVRVEARDFTLGEKPNDPLDPDGKLDVDQLQGIGITDLGQLFGSAPENPAMPIVTARSIGKHTLLLSDFELLSGDPPKKDPLMIDAFDSAQLSWSTPGGATFRIDKSREHAPGPAIEVSFGEGRKRHRFHRSGYATGHSGRCDPPEFRYRVRETGATRCWCAVESYRQRRGSPL